MLLPRLKKLPAVGNCLTACVLLSFLLCKSALPVENIPKAKPDPTVLSPDKMVGRAALGYAAAKEVPDICSKLFCYCGCDTSEEPGHTCLLDCFTCDHGVDCTVCQDEAIIALDLKKKGKSLREIQKQIDEAFQTLYPWEKPTPALEKYRESLKAGPVSPADAPKAGKTESFFKLPAQPGDQAKQRRYGGCCGHNRS